MRKRQENPTGNRDCFAAFETEKRRAGMAEYGTQSNGNHQQFGKPEAEVGDEYKGKPFPNINDNGQQAGLYAASPEDIDRPGIAITIFPGIFI
ncbi:unnamed protein product [marine sediment metagenome]|uniref:Uncharacterized protein n=1 Tax=marine sediment metagenome TaxID=412755 RepID=X0UX05_9ZZZZ